MDTRPRGIRFNNPLNIRIGNDWEGEVINPQNGQFEHFATPQAGIRAGAVILLRYATVYHHRTIREIIGRWAPHNENPTNAYVDYVATRLNISPNAPVDWTNDNWLASLIDAMIFFENGENPYPQNLVFAGINAAKQRRLV